jgi:formylmethanofuran dehydrogenase subunit B
MGVVVREEEGVPRIVEVRNACELGRAWFGDGVVSSETRVHGEIATTEEALDAAAELLGAAKRVLVYLAPDSSCEAQRAAVALADHLHGVVDDITSSTASAGVLAAQRRGRPTASLGEVRNRADLLVFWGADPAERYPRFLSRYAPDPEGIYVPGGRSDRTVIAVDIGDERGPADADVRIALEPDAERSELARLSASTLASAAGSGGALDPLSARFDSARYTAIVYDAEPSGHSGTTSTSEHSWRAEALVILAQQLNARIRCSLLALRAGGNRNGAEAVLTWQTGFPMTVDYSRGVPRYRPDEPSESLLARGAVDAIVVVGNVRAEGIPSMNGVPRVVIGPWASSTEQGAEIAIDTGVAGIHEGGMAFRMDDIPLPLRPVVPGPSSAPSTARVVEALAARVRARTAGAMR